MADLIYFTAVILPWFLIAGLAIWLVLAKDKIKIGRQIVWALVVAILTWFLVSLFKYNFPSPRPFEVIADLEPLFLTGRGDAFPSGHASFFGALALTLWWQNRRVGLIFLVGAILIAVARVLAGVHWPVDIVAGFAIAVVISSLVYWGGRRLIFGRFGL